MAASGYLRALPGEWLKTRRSLAPWLVLVGALFTPAVIIAVRLTHPARLARLYAAPDFWTSHWRSSWESMAIFFLPMAAILVTSLVTQIEHRSNAWKQVHTLPLTTGAVFLAKLTVIAGLTIVFVGLFDLGVYLSAVAPALVLDPALYPRAPLPAAVFAAETGVYMLACLPIIAGQYLMSLRFRNFMLPIGIGFMTWIAALAALSWRFGFVVPYSYTMLTYLKGAPDPRHAAVAQGPAWLPIAYAALFVAVGYGLFATQRQKG